jgi:hypothetical protein
MTALKNSFLDPLIFLFLLSSYNMIFTHDDMALIPNLMHAPLLNRMRREGRSIGAPPFPVNTL